MQRYTMTLIDRLSADIKYCYLIETENNKVFIPKTTHSLSKLNIKSNGNCKAKITYSLTGDKLPPLYTGCHHVGRVTTAVIEVIRVVKIK